MDRQYGIQPGSIDRAGRISPPRTPQRSPYTDYPPQQQSRSLRDVSPISQRSDPHRIPDDHHYAGGAVAGGMAADPYYGAPDNGSQALRDIDNLYSTRLMSPSPGPDYGPYGQPSQESLDPPSRPNPIHQHTNSQSSLTPLTAGRGLGQHSREGPSRSYGPAMGAAAGAGVGLGAGGAGGAPDWNSHLPRGYSYHGDGYDDFDPNSIADDGDDGLQEQPRSRNGHLRAAGAAGAGTGAGLGIAAGTGAGMLGALGAREPSGGNYGPVGGDAEKSAWLSKQSTGNKRLKWIVGIVIAVLVLGGIAGGVAGGLLANKNKSGGSSGSTAGAGNTGAHAGSHSGGLYDIDSDEVQAVLNDPRLHKVFPAMDYTPNYAQYPQCLAEGGGPVQNNVTIDVAIMSQLTPAIRLYGTDCNQTGLVMEAISQLKMQDTMKVWLGVYLDGNQTTNDRQIADMYDILDTYSHDSFVGVIVGNEVLYSEYLTATALGTILADIRSNFTSNGINLPVATADLGDNWSKNPALVQDSDIVMSNIHPFFAGQLAGDAAGWAYTFWTNFDQPLTTAKTGTVGDLTYPKQIISEIGWPSQGGNDCGQADSATYGCSSDTDGAVASIDNLNTFMDGWVCGALSNGTTFFWFEAFDEPWKHKFDGPHNKWEPYWGLFDSERNLKSGLNIPDCGGKTVDKPY